jgi:hypothetical protein
MPLPPLGPLSSEDVAGFLREYEFTANPAGLITHYRGDLTYESDSLAYLDINAIAVRRGDIAPDRPIRITFRCETNGAFAQWKLLYVVELTGVCHQRLWTGSRISPKSQRGREVERIRKAKVLWWRRTRSSRPSK